VKQKPIKSVIRLLCLLSNTLDGLPPKLYNDLRKEIIHSYGHDTLLILNNLEYSGLIKKQSNSVFFIFLI
jgi:vacuolar protein sorting-associated protein 33A